VNDAAIADDVDLEGDGEAEAPKRKLSGKKIVLFFLLPMLVVGGSMAVLLFGGVFGGSKEHAAHSAAQPAEMPKPVFFDLPDMLVNLNTTGRRPVFLKMQVSLQLRSDADVARLQAMSPRIIDTFQVYLRELRVDDLRGSAGIYRLREELLARVNAVVSPTRVKDVLFKEMLVQ
jgi:flagellar FliL protein